MAVPVELVPASEAQQKLAGQGSVVALVQAAVKAEVWRNLSAPRKLLADTVTTPMVTRMALNILLIVRFFLSFNLLLTSFVNENLNFISKR
jgi:hypothetical protein